MTATPDLQRQLLRYCQEYLPQYVDASLVDFRPLSDGWETEVYAFTLASKNGHEPLILRAYPGDDAVVKSAREFDGMRKLYRLHYPVPEVLQHSVDTSWLGKPFVIMRKINGEPMGRALLAATDEGRQLLITRFCQLFVQLHNLDWRPFLGPEAADYDVDDPLLFLRLKLAEAQRAMSEWGHNEFAPVLEWLYERMGRVPCERLSVMHQDFHPYNILLTPSDEAYVIDWGNISLGDFRYDLAWTLLLCSTYDHPVMRDWILTEYQRLSDQPIVGIEYFEVFAALRRLLTISVSVGVGAQKLGMRPEAVAMMESQAGHVRQVYQVLQKYTGLSLPEVERTIASLES